jgi:hypothetical protein
LLSVNTHLDRARHRDLEFERRALELKQSEAACTELSKQQGALSIDLEKREKEAVEQAERLRVWEEELTNKESDFVVWENSLTQLQERMRGIDERELKLKEAVAEHKRVCSFAICIMSSRIKQTYFMQIEDEFFNVRIAQITARHKQELQKLESMAATQLRVVSNFQTELNKSRQELLERTERTDELERLLRERDSLIDQLKEEVAFMKLGHNADGNEDDDDLDGDRAGQQGDDLDFDHVSNAKYEDDSDSDRNADPTHRFPRNASSSRGRGHSGVHTNYDTDSDEDSNSSGAIMKKHSSNSSKRRNSNESNNSGGNKQSSKGRRSGDPESKSSSSSSGFAKGTGKEFMSQLMETQRVLRHILESHDALPFKDSNGNTNYLRSKIGTVRGPISNPADKTNNSVEGPNRFLQTKPHVLGSNRGFAGLTAVNSNSYNMMSGSLGPLTGTGGSPTAMMSLFHGDSSGALGVHYQQSTWQPPPPPQSLQQSPAHQYTVNPSGNEPPIASLSTDSANVNSLGNGTSSLAGGYSSSPSRFSNPSLANLSSATTNSTPAVAKKSVNISISASDSNGNSPLTPMNSQGAGGSSTSFTRFGGSNTVAGGSYGSPSVSFAESMPSPYHSRSNTAASYGSTSVKSTDSSKRGATSNSVQPSLSSPVSNVDSVGIRGVPTVPAVVTSKVAFGAGISTDKPSQRTPVGSGGASVGSVGSLSARGASVGSVGGLSAGKTPLSPQSKVSSVEHGERKGIPVAKVSLRFN